MAGVFPFQWDVYGVELYVAALIAYKAHEGQVDKAGKPYILHPLHVMKQVRTIEEQIVALLHDVIEDTDCTLEDLRKEHFSEKVLEALALMTHDKTVPYMDYIAKIKENPLARAVKIADLHHNMDLKRIPNPTEKDYERLEKYKAALRYLTLEAPV